MVGDGSSLPITHHGSSSLPLPSSSLTLNNVLVSPSLIKNLCSVRILTRENPVTVEFDALGFSIKDARSRRVLHRCDSPDDLYPCGASSSGPVALHANVSLWHARLGHPGADALH